MKKFVLPGLAFMGFCAVAFGAFGAHALKSLLDAYQLETWKTASLYLLTHTLAGLWVGHQFPKSWSASFFLGGCVLFSGSLYALVLTQIKILGAITPVGGLLFMTGWLSLFINVTKNSLKNEK